MVVVLDKMTLSPLDFFQHFFVFRSTINCTFYWKANVRYIRILIWLRGFPKKKNCKMFTILLSGNSQRRPDHKENQTRKHWSWYIERRVLSAEEQGWRTHTGESTRVPLMWPRFESGRQRHMWVEFVVGSLACSERFFSGCSGFLLSLKTNTSKF